jgi:hypothetical protein
MHRIGSDFGVGILGSVSKHGKVIGISGLPKAASGGPSGLAGLRRVEENFHRLKLGANVVEVERPDRGRGLCRPFRGRNDPEASGGDPSDHRRTGMTRFHPNSSLP